MRFPDGRRLRRCRAGARLGRETLLRLWTIAMRWHRLRRVRDEPREHRAAASVLRYILSRLRACGAGRSSFLPSPGERGENPDWKPARCRSIVSRADRWRGPDSRANRDRSAAAAMRPASWRWLRRIVRSQSGRFLMHFARERLADVESLRRRIRARAARSRATDAQELGSHQVRAHASAVESPRRNRAAPYRPGPGRQNQLRTKGRVP